MGGGPRRKVVSPSWLVGTLAVPVSRPLLAACVCACVRMDICGKGGCAERQGASTRPRPRAKRAWANRAPSQEDWLWAPD